MGNHNKLYSDHYEFLKACTMMWKYQRIHNVLRKDFIELINVTEKYKMKKPEFDALYRACLRGLFSIIEADIFGLNNLDRYENYSDKDDFETKFKNTFKQVCKTWEKTKIQKKYFENNYSELRRLKKKRDELIHPKRVEHLHESSINDFEKIKKVFRTYESFVDELMNDFFISVNVDTTDLLHFTQSKAN